MNIPLVNTAPAGPVGSIAPVAPLQVQASEQSQTVAALIAQTTVDLSPLGKFLSAVTLFQKRMLALQANPAALAESEQAVATLASSVVSLADSANQLQASMITSTENDQSLADLFGQQFDSQTGIAGNRDNLSEIGLTFQPSQPGGEDVFAVDSDVLQAALRDDPQASTALLTRTAAAFGTLAGAVPEASADPSILFADDPAGNDPLALSSTGPALPVASETITPARTPAPASQSAAETTAPVRTDSAFLQELLAETPTIALAQAPPPSVTEATTSFIAQRVAERALQDADATPQITTRLPEPDPQLGSANVATAIQQPALTAPGEQISKPLQDGAPDEAEQILAVQEATREANARMTDLITAERDANERIATAVAGERAAQSAQLQLEQGQESERMRIRAQEVEDARLARARDEQRVDRVRDAQHVDDDELALPESRRPQAAATTAIQPIVVSDPVLTTTVAAPVTLPLDNAQQLARDPATLAAIAAYNLNAGPFAALNGRRELAAPKADVVPAVETVRKVAAIETDAATGESARPFR